MANEQNKSSLNPPTAGGTSGSPVNQAGQSTASAAQARKDPPSVDVSASPATLAAGGSQPKEQNNASFLDQAKNTAGQAYDAVAEKAATKIDEQKATLSGGLSSVADSIRKVGENLQGPDVQDGIGKFTREYSNTAAQKIEEVAHYFEHKDVKEMYRDVESFARSNPAIFIGGAFALGMLAARFLKSSSSTRPANSESRSLGSGQAFGSGQSYDKKFGSETRPAATNLH